MLDKQIICDWLRAFHNAVELEENTASTFELTSHMFRHTKASSISLLRDRLRMGIAAVLVTLVWTCCPTTASALSSSGRKSKQEANVDMYGRVTEHSSPSAVAMKGQLAESKHSVEGN